MILIQEILFLPPAELSWAVIQVRRKQSEFLAKGSRIKRYGFKTDLIYITRILKSLARVEILKRFDDNDDDGENNHDIWYNMANRLDLGMNG